MEDNLMASSDEEGEVLPDCISDYELMDQVNEHVSLALLPLLWQKDEVVDTEKGLLHIFLSGSLDNGLQRFYRQVLAWRLELSFVQPEIYVLCKGNHWVKLLKPKKLYLAAAFRTMLITIHCLHFVKHNLEATEESMWHHLARVLRMDDVAPSALNCLDHISLIRDAAERDSALASSQYVVRMLSDRPTRKEVLRTEGLPVKQTEFIVDDAAHHTCEADEMFTKEEELFDTCCSFCDNGGDILCCEGRCMRSFHPTKASDEGCESLGLSKAEVRAIPIFICKNCQYQQHQCFICGRLGSSDISANAEVFPCVAANCGRFYHPTCVANELQQRKITETENLDEKIGAGESFVCPAHICFVCKQVEDRTVKDMQFAVCRRCPKSYHRKCLPREIAFDNGKEMESLPRAWDDVLPKRILIYCLDHDIDPELGTPLRNHILFPVTIKLKRPTVEQDMTAVNLVKKKRKLIPLHSTKVVGEGVCKPSSDGQVRLYSTESTSRTTGHAKCVQKPHSSSTVPSRQSLLEKNKLNFEKRRHDMKPSNAYMPGKKLSTQHTVNSVMKKGYSSPVADIEMEKRISALVEQVFTSFDVNEFIKSEKVPTILKKTKEMFNKNLTKGKVEVACKAVKEALQKLESGGSLDDAKAVCSVDMLRQVPLWKSQLRVYLAPFLHGMHYTSYGRHFTKSEKLQEIVNRLHSYVLDGDMIVDFCCGANEFSCLMKEKLDTMGKKKCSFKNFDLFPPKNDFNFEQKDWFEVEHKDLPHGSQLIMGLNPPFGINASLANEFISKALEFNPKLLILIVPPETHRLDRNRKTKYDLVWEDNQLLAGEAFYLPGIFDDNDKQLSQWNNTTPPLYLWSRPDWTRKHEEIANRCGHSWGLGKPPCTQPPAWNHVPHEQQDGDIMAVYDDLPSMYDDVPGPMSKLHENSVMSNTESKYLAEDSYSHVLNYENPGTSGIYNTYSHYGPMRNSYSSIPSYESTGMTAMYDTYANYVPVRENYSSMRSYDLRDYYKRMECLGNKEFVVPLPVEADDSDMDLSPIRPPSFNTHFQHKAT